MPLNSLPPTLTAAALESEMDEWRGVGLRLEVNHPLYALAWWGGAEFVALLAERHLAPAAARTTPFRRWLVPALAVTPPR